MKQQTKLMIILDVVIIGIVMIVLLLPALFMDMGLACSR